MNVYGAIVLAALLGKFALDATADVLNLRALRPEAPPEFRDVYDPARYRRAQEYTRARARFGFVPATVGLAALLAFWFAGGFGALDRVVRALGWGPIPSGLAYLGALGLGAALLRLPFRWWSTFVIEARFGFNTTTPRTFWADVAKGAALSAVLGGGLLAVVLWVFERAGRSAWLWASLATAGFVVVVQYVTPTWIMPLFNRFTPLGPGALRDEILGYARRVAFPLEGVFVIDGSRRSTKANAFFTGFGRRKRIALFDTLVRSLSTPELVAVVAHEVGHYKRRHVLVGMVLSILQTGAMLFLLSLVLDRPGLFAAFGVERPSVYAGLVLFALLVEPLGLVLSTALHALSRRHEFEADAFAVDTTGSGERLATALTRLSADSLSNLTPHPLYVFLHYSHPPLRDRLAALRRPAPRESRAAAGWNRASTGD
ncbi:MAG TPA: M48 family metallopeptidase [Candidatus Binatia bacterium]|nr:M48 family metallopeptidase [Candidatus Binatia bacterium]